jgi:hypothetical protein
VSISSAKKYFAFSRTQNRLSSGKSCRENALSYPLHSSALLDTLIAHAAVSPQALILLPLWEKVAQSAG